MCRLDAKKPKIMVVDDQPNAVELIRMMLGTRGYDVVVARSGAEAIDLIEGMVKKTPGWQPFPIELILLDIRMPGVDGFKVCQRVKHDPLLSHIPVIMVTALESASDKVAAVEFGADDYITKPFLPEELGAAIKAKLQVKRREEALLRRTRELEAINAVSAAANSSLDPSRVARDSFDTLVENVDLAAAALFRHDEAHKDLRRVIQWGVTRPQTLPEEGLAAQIFRAENPVLKVDLRDDPDLTPNSLGRTDLGAFIGVALRAGEQSLGILEVYHSQPYGLEEQDLAFYAQIGTRIGSALQNAEIFQQAQTLLLKSSSLGPSG